MYAFLTSYDSVPTLFFQFNKYHSKTMTDLADLEDTIADSIKRLGLSRILLLKLGAVNNVVNLLKLLAPKSKYIVVVIPSDSAVSIPQEIKSGLPETRVIVYSSSKLKDDEILIAF